MNHSAVKFHQENGDMIQQLVESLDAILKKFNEGIIPGEPEKSDAMYMLDTYLDCLINFKKEKPPAFIKVSDKLSKPYDESIAVSELMPKRESIDLLLKFGREKMLLTTDSEFESDGGRVLRDGGYYDEIIAGSNEIHYYILSEKGEKAIGSKSLLSSIRKKVCTAIIPKGLLNDSFKWSDLYVRRVEMINQFFRTRRENAEHIVFSLDESKEMVFGCEVNDSEDVDYIFAGIFDEKIDDHLSQIKNITKSGKVDHLIIINSSEDGKALLESEGLSSVDYPQIQYELLK